MSTKRRLGPNAAWPVYAPAVISPYGLITRIRSYLEDLGGDDWHERAALVAIGPKVLIPTVDATAQLFHEHGLGLTAASPLATETAINLILQAFDRADALVVELAQAGAAEAMGAVDALRGIAQRGTATERTLVGLFVGDAPLPHDWAMSVVAVMDGDPSRVVRTAAAYAAASHALDQQFQARARAILESSETDLSALPTFSDSRSPTHLPEEARHGRQFIRYATMILCAFDAAPRRETEPGVESPSASATASGTSSLPRDQIASSQQWDYAVMRWDGVGLGSTRHIEFTNQEPRRLKLGHMRQLGAIAMLGEYGYELVSVTGVLRDDAQSVSTWRRPRRS